MSNPKSIYAKLPPVVQQALDARGIEDSDELTPEQCFTEYCEWHGIIGWNLWQIVKQCEGATA